jgi:hypothetical protein
MAQLKNTTINDTGFLQLPQGTTEQRPASAQNGQMRFNTTFNTVEWYDGNYSTWFPVGVISPIATGGATTNITQSGINYRVHTFTSVGTSTFTVTRGGLVEYLIVGGGGGGADVGGGGSGGVLQGQILLDPQAYSIVVGAGTGNAGDNTGPGDSGGPSFAFNLVAAGGGGAGAGFTQAQGIPGGSGGGGGRNPAGDLWALGGPGIPGQGFQGGHGVPWHTADWEAGGGGGAGSYGRVSIAGDWGGDGGPGVNSRITGTLQTYGGGGGSGSNSIRGRGGLGGGGSGRVNADGTNYNGVANTGGGGGGGWTGDCGAGGSGIVVVRYRIS